MRKNYIVKAAALMIGVLVMSACTGRKKDQNTAHEDPGVVKIDSNLSHLLKPSNEQVVSTLPVIKADYGTKIFTEEAQGVINYDTRNQNSVASRVSGRIERLFIKYNYQPVKKGQLIMEVYSPDLAAAQQELLFLKRSETDLTLLDRAKQRLMLLGMSASGINQVLKTGKVNYRIPVYSNADGYILEKSAAATPSAAPSAAAPAAGGDGMSGMGASSGASAALAAAAAPVNIPVMLREGQYVSAGQSLFTIYNADKLVAEFSFKPSLASLVKQGDKFSFYKTADKSTIQTATIGMIQPIFKDGENFTIARIYLNKPNFRVGELLTARIPVLLAASWWLPESAVLSLGNKTVVFKKEGNVVLPKSVKAGITIAGMVQIKEDISNWEISQNAAYLVDSESFIKAQLK
ncbi:efflux RND transporter periplasmic adaptor subunit [Pedobacter hiemivivus]|uniref:Biotin/lipoyl-binding protein n=1 Tax=Pedobacter hiemivivus TaxID=2530454 RepID=A0A4R0NCB7_9SPHI|nr:efflux RND transporter periplasmic adaptor subunit [Pedobacter hiemivivus]TCC96054.1 biotin/lipoyl-binding protein [Pedobacter hiemivivus]